MVSLNKIKTFIIFSLLSIWFVSCQNLDNKNNGAVINRDAELVLQNLFEIDPDTISIYKNAAATLIIPRITKAGFVLGGAYGEGVLRINEAPVDYYSGFSFIWLTNRRSTIFECHFL